MCHIINITYESIVNTILQGALMTAYHICIGTCQSEGIHTVRLQTCYQILVDQAAIDHCHHLQHIGIRDAASAHHLRLNA